MLSGLRSELAVLQSAFTQQKRQQQQHKVQEACAEVDRQQEVRGHSTAQHITTTAGRDRLLDIEDSRSRAFDCRHEPSHGLDEICCAVSNTAGRAGAVCCCRGDIPPAFPLDPLPTDAYESACILLLYLFLQQSLLQQELSCCKEALAEAQQEVARLEVDSRQLEAIRRSTTPNPPPRSSRIPLPPSAARPATAAGNYASPRSAGGAGTGCEGRPPQQQQPQQPQLWLAAPAVVVEQCSTSSRGCSSGGSSSGASSPCRIGIPALPLGPRPHTAAPALSSRSEGGRTAPSPPPVLLPDPPASRVGSCHTSAGHTPSSNCSSGPVDPTTPSVLITPRRASEAAAAAAVPGFSRASAGGVLHRDLAALRRLSGHSSPGKQPQTAPAPALDQGVPAGPAQQGSARGAAGSAASTSRPAAAATAAAAAAAGPGSSPSMRRRTWTAAGAAVPLLQALTSPRPSDGIVGSGKGVATGTTPGYRASMPGA